MPQPDTTVFWTLAQAGGTALPSEQLLGAPPGQGTAQGVPGATGAPGQGTGAGGGSPMGFMLPLIAILGFMILMTTLTSRREKKKRAEMMSSLKRHDKVLTIGGILGTVAEIRDDEVVLRVDETNNTKIRVTRSSIQQVLNTGADAGAAPTVEVKTKGERAAV